MKESFHKAASRVSLDPEPEDHGNPWMCAAHGCPMWGTISDQVVGNSGKRWCRFHFGESHEIGDRITRKFRLAMDVVAAEQESRRQACEGGSLPAGFREAARNADHALGALARTAIAERP